MAIQTDLSKIDITPVRFEAYPPDNPTGTVVALRVQLPNKEVQRFQTTVSDTDDAGNARGWNSQQIGVAAYYALRPEIITWIENVEDNPAFLNQTFTADQLEQLQDPTA